MAQPPSRSSSDDCRDVYYLRSNELNQLGMDTRHVPSLELCQEFDRLCKEKNITIPETEFYWVEATISGEWYLASNADNHYSPATKGFFPAPLVSEQLEWLPKFTKISRGYGNTNAHLYIYPDKYDRFENSPSNAAQGLINDLIAKGVITKL